MADYRYKMQTGYKMQTEYKTLCLPKNYLNLNIISAFIVGGSTMLNWSVGVGEVPVAPSWNNGDKCITLGDASPEDSREDSNIEVSTLWNCHRMVFSSVYLQDNLMLQNHWNDPGFQNRISNQLHSVKFNHRQPKLDDVMRLWMIKKCIGDFSRSQNLTFTWIIKLTVFTYTRKSASPD